MAKYRKKPVVVEAMQFTDEMKDRVFNWITCSKSPCIDDAGKPTLKIQTLEGVMTANLGDWIIKGVQGEFYPCRADIFAETYEAVEDEPDCSHLPMKSGFDRVTQSYGYLCGKCGEPLTEAQAREI